MNDVTWSRARATALTLAATLLAASCSGGGDADEAAASAPPSSSAPAATEPTEPTEATDDGSPDSAGGPTEGPYLPVPDDVELTAQGTLLAVGKPATVAFRPSAKKKKVGVLTLRVDRLRRTTFAKSFQGWKLTKATRRTTPYFVSVTVRNVGRTPLGGTPVPLFLLDDKNTLRRATTFEGDFEPCPSRVLPAGFVRGERTSVCLTYLLPKGRSLAGVTFRPTKRFEAITWVGDVERPGQKKRDRTQRNNENQQGRTKQQSSG